LAQRGRGEESRQFAADDDLSGSKVVVLGLARQGTAAAEFLARVGADVTVSDLRERSDLAEPLSRLEGLPIRFELGGHPAGLLAGADVVCLSGGVPMDAPVVREAQLRGIPLTNDAQLLLERCPARVVGITGSAGKTTTTALVGEMFRAAGMPVWVGGNIGNPLIGDLPQIKPEDLVVLELSSFQLEIMTASPAVAAVLNITPNHLDRHKTMGAYIAAKKNILSHQQPSDAALLGYDDTNAKALADDAPAGVTWFSLLDEVEEGAFGTGGRLTVRQHGTERQVCLHQDVRLLGGHNLLNILAACALAQTVGVPAEAMSRVATSFAGVEHRLEFVAQVRGAKWYNDSIATAPERSLAALRSFDDPIVLLAGGRDKKLMWDEFATEVTRRVRHIVTFGEAGPMIARLFDGRTAAEAMGNEVERAVLESVTETGTLEEAVEAAAVVSRAGDVVLLSPGGTSFDAFGDFAERGSRFRKLVACL
jgi:UDP-N-acetylmuramoylalanine--D-glutamate ligase